MATKAAGSTSEAMRQKTAERAYLIWESMGRPHGHDRQHWIQAEAEVLGKGATASAKAAPKTTATKATSASAKTSKSTVTSASASAAMAAGAAPAKGPKKPTRK